MLRTSRLMLLLSVVMVLPVTAEDKNPLRERIDDEHALGTDLWVYNDISKAMAEAKRQNKPLFVTFRCVPCQACAGFDATVAKGSDRVHNMAVENFIPVRQVEMKGVDLSQFQFDYDLNWAAMFINADGTVYARYGTQSADGPDAYNSVEGLINTMNRVVELHKNYPNNKNELKDKRGAKKPYKTAIEMPGLENKERYRGVTTRKNCIHCHTLNDAMHVHAHETKTFNIDQLFRYPLPDQIGLMIAGDDGLKVKKVVNDSPAAQAGFQTGEDITHINGQALTSIADMQWALNSVPNAEAKITVTGSKTGKKTLALNKGWKASNFSWRGSMWSVEPKLRVWTPPLTEKQRQQRGLPTDQEAFEVRWINTGSAGGRSARDAGLRQKDIIVAVDGKKLNMTTQEFNMHLKLNYKVGDKLPLTVLRNGKRVNIEIPLVE